MLACVSSLLILPAQARVSGLEEIEALAASGQCAEAYAIMAPLEIQMAGDIEFDLLFAHCALEVDQTGLAMLALERVLSAEPANKSARFLLARAYYRLNAIDGARREFELLLSLNPSPGLRASVGQYLDAIAGSRPGAARSLTGYFEFGLGHDDNVTGGASRDLIYLPGLEQNLRLVANELEDADGYGVIATGIDTLHRVGKSGSFYAGADLSARSHHDRSDVDYLLAALRAGYTHGWRNQALRFGLGAGQWRIDDAAYQDFRSLELEWRSTLSRRNQIGVTAVFDRYRHRESADRTLDYDDSRLRLSYSRLLGPRADRLLSLSLDHGQEDDVEDRDDGKRDYLGLTITGQMGFGDALSGFLILASQKDDYSRINPLFAQKRSESQKQIAVGIVWEFRKRMSLRTTLAATDIDSSFSIYDSSGTDFSIVLRRDFE